MRGKNHLISGIILIFIIMIIDLVSGLKIYAFVEKNLIILIFSLYLFFAGLLLPDADKINSWIFKFFLPFAVISWSIGFLISLIKNKKFRHRGFLHTFQGIIITSLSSSILGFALANILINVNYYILAIFFMSIFTGQLLHLLFD